jgi:drug/metabolite transporter (DMT)-like permease
VKQLESRSDTASTRLSAVFAILGFIVVAGMLSTNNIVARANAGEIPSFSLAFFRWMTVALGLTPFAVREIREKWSVISPRIGMVAIAGFCGVFLCGGPVYAAAVTTTAISIGLVMAAAPVNVLLIAWCLGLENVKPVQLISVVVAVAGVALILLRGSLETLASVNFVPGDIIVLVAMLGWTVYNLLEVRALPGVSSISRTCLYAATGAAFSLPLCLREALHDPQAVFSAHALTTYLFLAAVPGFGAYAGFAFLGAKFGSVRASLITYVVPISCFPCCFWVRALRFTTSLAVC